MQAHFILPFEDLDYESWVKACGADGIRIEPREDGAFDGFVEGPPEALESFEADLGFSREA